MSKPLTACPCCHDATTRVFHEVRGVPANSQLMLRTRDDAIAFPKGDIALGLCRNCGFVYNTAFDASLIARAERCEPAQTFSTVFDAALDPRHRRLAEQLVDRYGLRDKRIIEIGCGNGEFLHLLCELGNNAGVGFDPAYDAARDPLREDRRTRFIADLYSEKYASIRADFVCCSMTLEHIQPAAAFVSMVRRALGDATGTHVLFQVPDAQRILTDTAFWDIYYEHCAYYSPGSLSRLFQRSGFDVLGVFAECDGQYLVLVAKPNGASLGPAAHDHAEHAWRLAERFSATFKDAERRWRERLARWGREGRRAVVWGSGSNGVAFLTTLRVTNGIDCVVDIDPRRQGYYMAGTGQRIVGPAFLSEYRPDVVIITNPAHRREVVEQLNRQALTPEVVDAG